MRRYMHAKEQLQNLEWFAHTNLDVLKRLGSPDSETDRSDATLLPIKSSIAFCILLSFGVAGVDNHSASARPTGDTFARG